MLRCSLLLLLLPFPQGYSAPASLPLLPQSGQSVDLYNGDLSQRIRRLKPEVSSSDRLYSLHSESLPTLYFLRDEGRFSIPGVAASGAPEVFDEQGVLRYIYSGKTQAGAMDKSLRIEWLKLDEGQCHLSWKLIVIHHGETIRNQQGSIAYECEEKMKDNPSKRVLSILPNAYLDNRLK